MGAWGPAIFSDDVALDVKSYYRELIEDGKDADEAKSLVVSRFTDYLNSSDDKYVFWLTLAATQWQLGRMDEETKDRALEIIDGDLGLDQWEDAGPAGLKARKAVLQKLREKLLSPQPPPKKLRKPWKYESDLLVGDAISYKLDSGKKVIFRVVAIESNRYWIAPVLELCDWIGETVPPAKVIARLSSYIDNVEGPANTRILRCVQPHKKNAYPSDRIEVVARGLKVREGKQWNSWCTWLYIDGWLDRISNQLRLKPPLILGIMSLFRM